MSFAISSNPKPTGDQPKAIKALIAGVSQGYLKQTLLGVTGSGKTVTMAHTIAQTKCPTLVISPNKTLAAQLASEFKALFPEAAVHYFVSYFDYYQPEAYIPASDTYIAKDSAINQEIDRLRHATTHDLLTRQDVIVIATVSCIYGMGRPEDYDRWSITLKTGQMYDRRDLLSKLTAIRYERNDYELYRGRFSVKGEAITIWPADVLDRVTRLTFSGDELHRLEEIDSLTGQVYQRVNTIVLYPASHYLATGQSLHPILTAIREELRTRLDALKKENRLLEAERLEQRVAYDLEMIETTSHVNGIENYSRYFDGRQPGEPSFTLIDYFRYAYGADWLCFIDESHVTVPQLGGMYAGDRSRKQTLVDFGFRLPSALDHRPLRADEFWQRAPQTVFVSATPGNFERENSKAMVEQIIRPTGLLDPKIEVRQSEGQMVDLLREIQAVIKKKQRVLVTTITKRLAEDIADHLQSEGIKAHYLHSEQETFERVEVLRDLRSGKYDVLVGINLLREGLDLPEVSLVAILDADKEGFLRGETALIQIMGRAARHAEGRVIMYADTTTKSMRVAISETDRRRAIQEKYNKAHHIIPTTISKPIGTSDWLPLPSLQKAKQGTEFTQLVARAKSPQARALLIEELTQQMDLASRNLDFERAAFIRDQIVSIKKRRK